MKNWLWKTLFGYTACLTSDKGTFTVVHRPFRKPILRYDDLTNVKINGLTISGIFIDEAEDVKE